MRRVTSFSRIVPRHNGAESVSPICRERLRAEAAERCGELTQGTAIEMIRRCRGLKLIHFTDPHRREWFAQSINAFACQVLRRRASTRRYSAKLCEDERLLEAFRRFFQESIALSQELGLTRGYAAGRELGARFALVRQRVLAAVTEFTKRT